MRMYIQKNKFSITYMLFTLKFQKKAQIVFICSGRVLSKCSILKKDTSYWNQKKSILQFLSIVLFTMLSSHSSPLSPLFFINMRLFHNL